MNFKPIVVYDFETDGVDPETCSPVQLGACVIHSRKLFRMDNEFNSMIRPEGIDEPNYIEDHLKTIEWHAKLRKTTIDDIVAGWKKAPSQEKVWADYVEFVKRLHSNPAKATSYGAPLRAGYNIINFDDKICNRLCKKYDTKVLYSPIHKYDLMDLLFPWMEGVDGVERMNLDYLRDYFGMKKENAHDALQDVKDTADILIRVLKLQRSLAPKVKFKDSFKYV